MRIKNVKLRRDELFNHDKELIFTKLYEELLTCNPNKPVGEILKTILAKHPTGQILTVERFIRMELKLIKKEVKNNGCKNKQ